MDYRVLGRTGLAISAIGFGCGNTGGLLVRGREPSQRLAVARALEGGINYLDTAAQYDDGTSETNLGVPTGESSRIFPHLCGVGEDRGCALISL